MAAGPGPTACGSATIATATGRRIVCSSAITLAARPASPGMSKRLNPIPSPASSSVLIPRNFPRAATAHISS